MIALNPVQQSALYWHNLGIGVIPVAYRHKTPVVRSWREFQNQLPTLDQVCRWFEFRFRNLAIITGWRGLVVLDFDAMPVYDLWRVWAEQESPAAASSYSVATSRGVHVYLFIDEPVQTQKLGTIDIKAAGGYVLAPPSIHPTGVPYRQLTPGLEIATAATLAEVMPHTLHQSVTISNPVHQPSISMTPARGEMAANPWDAAISPTLARDTRIEDIRATHSLFDLLPAAQRKGNRWVTRCPLHNDHNASLTIDADGQRCRCWAGCTPPAGYDVIDLFAALNGITVQQAITQLA